MYPLEIKDAAHQVLVFDRELCIDKLKSGANLFFNLFIEKLRISLLTLISLLRSLAQIRRDGALDGHSTRHARFDGKLN